MRHDARIAILLGGALGALAVSGRLGDAQEYPPTQLSTPKPAPADPSCARPNTSASVIQAAPAVTPAIAEQQGIVGDVQVIVSLDADSRVVGVRIQSSPSAVLNPAALAAARHSTFQTETRDCRPLAADYLYTVEFVKKATLSTASSGERIVSVVGQGTVTRAPDTAAVVATIVTYDDDAETATAKNDAAFAELTAKLSALGIAERNVRGTPFLRPLPARASTVSHGYMSSRRVDIAVDTVAIAGHAATAAAALASVDTVAIRYALNDRASAYREALNIALKDGEQSARDALAFERLQLGKLKQVAVPPNDRTRPPSTIVPFHLVPVMGGLKEPDLRIPELEVHAFATVTYFVKP